jgi:hypothetical protein
MNPYAVLMLARSMDQDRERAAEQRRVRDLVAPMPRESRPAWAAVTRFPRLATSSPRG